MTDIIFTTIGQIFFLAMPFWLIGLGLLLSQCAGILQWGVEGTVLLVSGLMLPLAGQGLGVALSVAALVGIAMAIFYFFISNLLKGSNLMAGIIVLLIGFALQKILTAPISDQWASPISRHNANWWVLLCCTLWHYHIAVVGRLLFAPY